MTSLEEPVLQRDRFDILNAGLFNRIRFPGVRTESGAIKRRYIDFNGLAEQLYYAEDAFRVNGATGKIQFKRRTYDENRVPRDIITYEDVGTFDLGEAAVRAIEGTYLKKVGLVEAVNAAGFATNARLNDVITQLQLEDSLELTLIQGEEKARINDVTTLGMRIDTELLGFTPTANLVTTLNPHFVHIDKLVEFQNKNDSQFNTINTKLTTEAADVRYVQKSTIESDYWRGDKIQTELNERMTRDELDAALEVLTQTTADGVTGMTAMNEILATKVPSSSYIEHRTADLEKITQLEIGLSNKVNQTAFDEASFDINVNRGDINDINSRLASEFAKVGLVHTERERVDELVTHTLKRGDMTEIVERAAVDVAGYTIPQMRIVVTRMIDESGGPAAYRSMLYATGTLSRDGSGTGMALTPCETGPRQIMPRDADGLVLYLNGENTDSGDDTPSMVAVSGGLVVRLHKGRVWFFTPNDEYEYSLQLQDCTVSSNGVLVTGGVPNLLDVADKATGSGDSPKHKWRVTPYKMNGNGSTVSTRFAFSFMVYRLQKHAHMDQVLNNI